jgi:ATP-binding cassette, subfamily B (MDR/TAP), member 1
MVDQDAAKRDTNRVLDLIYTPEAQPIDALSTQGQPLERVKGAIEFKNLRFKYPARPDVWVLGGPDSPDGFSLSVPAGQTVAFVGQSGSGESQAVRCHG